MSTADVTRVGPAPTRRPFSYPLFAIAVVVYLAIIQGIGLLVQNLSDESDFDTTRGVFFGMIIPLGLALVFVYGLAAYLGRLRPVLRDDHPTQRWVWVVPIIFIVAIAVGINYGELADKGFLYVVVLLIATQFVGWGEEGMFRGLGVTVLREHGLSEGRVALWSSIIFGAVHLTNVVGHGISALPQAIIVSLAGYFFYLVRRVSRGNVLNSVLHGLFDFSLLTGTAITAGQTFYPGTLLPVLVYPLLAIILLVRRKQIEPAVATA
ncbi:CPBP family intramembrane glutamic endopeptidase [Nocardia tengchongensis]|uniref:CPBP family intramembrane glutamic endopeptidase n=2 Tax=Nocardia tengchongensis TaxID=2055889 RepID=UPI0036AC2DD8